MNTLHLQNKVAQLEGEKGRLSLELEQAWQQVRVLKAREARRNIDLAFSEESRKLATATTDLLSDLEFFASPIKAIPLSQPISGSNNNEQEPGEAQKRERALLRQFQQKLDRLLFNTRNQLENMSQ